MARRAKSIPRPKKNPITRRDGLTVSPQPEAGEMEQRRELVLALVMRGATLSAIVQACHQELGLSPSQVRYVHQLVIAELRADFEQQRKDLKAQQFSRLQNAISRMYSQASPPWARIVQFEQLLARITGTMEPIRHQVGFEDVPDAFAAVVAGMTREDMDRAMDEQLELERRARAIDTVGEPAE